MMRELKISAELGSVFLRIGMFTFGGGYAMLPLLQSELVEKRKWLTQEQLMDYFCIGQSTPGIIAVNTATFVGYNRAGVLGAVVATLALVTVPMVIILALANVLTLYMENPYVDKAFTGIRIVVTALIAEAVLKLWKTAMKKSADAAIFAAALLLSVLGGISPAVIVLGFGLLGGLLSLRKAKK